jgi:NAD(P)H-hydrate epimerase
MLLPALTGRESEDFDLRAIRDVGVPQPVLMENAGRSAAQVVQRLFPVGPVLGLVGAGNNGGDALVALRTLAAWGRSVHALWVADRAPGDPLHHGWALPGTKDSALDDAGWSALLGGAAVVLDGILGTGTRGAPRSRQADAIRRLNASGRPVVALDLPSGVDATTGFVAGDAVEATVTVCFGAPKLGALLHPGRAIAGRVLAVEIGFPPLPLEAATGQVVTPAWAQSLLPRRATDTHKNAVGRLVLVAGKAGMAGAAILAARAALRAGVGLIQVCSPVENRGALQAAVPEAIFVDPSEPSGLENALAEADAVAVGPGLGTGPEAEALLARVIAVPGVPVVADADALNLMALARPSEPRAALAGRPALITPHPGEMARLLAGYGSSEGAEGADGEDRARLALDRVAQVREASRAFGCAVLLKGAPSLVAAGEAPVLVDTQGSSDLAVAGMGDVLTGICGGLMAQGLAPAAAGAAGLYLSGRAAAIAGRGASLVPSDVVRWLPDALAQRGAGTTDLDLPFLLLDLDAAR